ncbi:MAG: regulatory protein RecX [Rikenellaceae bacterium]
MCPAGFLTKRKVKSAERALEDLMRECAKAEKSSGDARRLMSRWGVSNIEREGIIEQLKAMKFIDHRRYAEAFVRDKINLSRWGTQRIRLELSRKEIESEIIDEVLASLNKDIMQERLLSALEKRMRTTKYKDTYDLKTKLLRYGASLGYDYTMLSEAIAKIINNNDNDECEDTFF